MSAPSPGTVNVGTGVIRSTRGPVEIVTVRGAIDMSSVGAFKQALSEAMSATAPKVVVVCQDVTFMNSTGIGALYSCHCDCRAASGAMVLCRAPARVQELVAMIGLQEVFVQADSEDAAVAILDPETG